MADVPGEPFDGFLPPRVLALNANEDCPICLDVLKSPAVTPCAHVFCKACIERVIEVGLIAYACRPVPATPMCTIRRLSRFPPGVRASATTELSDVPPGHPVQGPRGGSDDRGGRGRGRRHGRVGLWQAVGRPDGGTTRPCTLARQCRDLIFCGRGTALAAAGSR